MGAVPVVELEFSLLVEAVPVSELGGVSGVSDVRVVLLLAEKQSLTEYVLVVDRESVFVLLVEKRV